MSIYFEWTENMSVGEKTIDEQHQRLLVQVNNLIKTITFGPASDEVAEALHFLDQYINEHFTYEENYMKTGGYPELVEHMAKHQQFIDSYGVFKKDFRDDMPQDKLILEIERYLGNWWLEHIGKEDKKYYLFLK